MGGREEGGAVSASSGPRSPTVPLWLCGWFEQPHSPKVRLVRLWGCEAGALDSEVR